jgi:CRP-like cAMP-binding protein
VGSSREAVARLLKELRARQVVTTRRRRIVVLRPEVLRRIIGERSA